MLFLMNSAIGTAMDQQRPFSWIKGPTKGKVQAGVYLRYSQEIFNRYIIK